MKARHLILAALAVIPAACSVSTRSVSLREHAPRPADHPIEVFVSEVPTRDYEEIGLVGVCVDDTFGDVDELMPALRAKARELGGDAVIGLKGSLTGGGLEVDGATLDDDPALSGTVIRYRSS